MKIFFVWDWPVVDHQTIGWEDGLAAAIKVISNQGHHIEVFCPGEISRELEHPYFKIHIRNHLEIAAEQFEPDVILMWGDCTRPNAKVLRSLGIPMALCFAGGNQFGETVDYFDHLFVESDVYLQNYIDKGYDASIAFGTNTELFKPITGQPKIFDTIFPATFAHWKRHGLYSEATKGFISLAVGLIQPNGIDESSWRDSMNRGVLVLPHVTANVLRYLYAGSRVCVVTSESIGGSQRTVLEAMAMNIPLVITDSDKFDWARGHGVFEVEPRVEQIKGCITALLDGEHEINTREYIVNNWSETNYANALIEGLEKLIA